MKAEWQNGEEVRKEMGEGGKRDISWVGGGSRWDCFERGVLVMKLLDLGVVMQRMFSST